MSFSFEILSKHYSQNLINNLRNSLLFAQRFITFYQLKSN